MTTDEKIDALIQQFSELSDEAQADLFRSFAEMRSQHLGVFNTDGL